MGIKMTGMHLKLQTAFCHHFFCNLSFSFSFLYV
jgi:hypothetical protein